MSIFVKVNNNKAWFAFEDKSSILYLGVPLELELRGAGLSHRRAAGCRILGGHLEYVIIIIS